MNDEPEPWSSFEEEDAGADELPEMTPEQEERATARLHAALAVERRRWARRQALGRIARAGLVATGVAGVVALALCLAAPAREVARRLAPVAARAVGALAR